MTGAPTKVPSLIPPRGVSMRASLGALSGPRPTVRVMVSSTQAPAYADGSAPPIRAALSPSRASDFMQCPLLYRFRVVDRLPQAPSSAAARGTLVHAVLERLFDLPADQRTYDAARELLQPQWAELLAAEPELATLFPDDGGAALADLAG